MIKAKDDGGPAFPVISEGVSDRTGKTIMPDYPGMTLRAWFAGNTATNSEEYCDTPFEALAGPTPNPDSSGLSHLKWRAKALARWRFMQADAMIEENNRKGIYET